MIYLCKIFKKITRKKKLRHLKQQLGSRDFPLTLFSLSSSLSPSIPPSSPPSFLQDMECLLLCYKKKTIKWTNKLNTVPHTCVPSTWIADLDIQRPCLK